MNIDIISICKEYNLNKFHIFHVEFNDFLGVEFKVFLNPLNST